MNEFKTQIFDFDKKKKFKYLTLYKRMVKLIVILIIKLKLGGLNGKKTLELYVIVKYN